MKNLWRFLAKIICKEKKMFKLKEKVNELIAHVSSKEDEVDLKLRNLTKLTNMLDEDISAIEKTLEQHNKKIDILMEQAKNYKKTPTRKKNLRAKDLLKGYEFKKDYYTPKELSKITGVHYTTILKMINSGRLKAKKNGREYFIPVKQ